MNERPKYPNAARPILSETPETRAERERFIAEGGHLPTVDEMRASIKASDLKVLPPFFEELRRQQGIPKRLENVRIIGTGRVESWLE